MTQPRLVGGRYELGELIGYGGMAEVHRGHDIRLGREVAIKVLRADLARDPSFLNRFRREAQAAAGLNHPSIVSVYDTGEDIGQDGTVAPYIVMEFIAGRTLRDVLKAEGRLPARRVMEIGADICGALDFSHRNGIVHRDIKPANVMITPTGAVKVMDFGIARALADNSATVTQTANVIGTAQYLSPEQARGEAVDARSDVYSTGCLLYELATGSPPFQGDSPVAVAYQHVRENATAPSARNPEVPAALDSIVMKSLAKNQLNRYQSAGDMRTDLQRALANQPVAAEAVMSDAERTQFIARTPVPPVAVVRRDQIEPEEPDRARRNGLIWLAIVVAMLVVIGGVVALVLVSKKDNNSTGPTAQVPTVIGQQPDKAISLFAAQKLTLTPATPATTPDNCDGNTTPDAGTVCTLRQGGNVVTAGERIPENSVVVFQTYLPTKQVPDLYGLDPAAAQAALTKLGLVGVNAGATSGTCDNNQKQVLGKICTQDKALGTKLPVGQQVRFQTYAPQAVPVPTVTGISYSDAANLLQTKGFKVVRDPTPAHTNDAPETVVKQSPGGGNTATQGATITLTVSDGKVVLPNEATKKLDAAKTDLNKLGFTNIPTPTYAPTDDPKLDNTVQSMDPTPGIAYPTSTAIQLTVYKYAAPTGACLPTGTPATLPPGC
ncbi:MAG: Stk1 family PASTA domain-containing Ser/Thr kinase [Jatrophihabitantaceae bacterium]